MTDPWPLIESHDRYDAHRNHQFCGWCAVCRGDVAAILSVADAALSSPPADSPPAGGAPRDGAGDGWDMMAIIRGAGTAEQDIAALAIQMVGELGVGLGFLDQELKLGQFTAARATVAEMRRVVQVLDRVMPKAVVR